MSKTSQSLDIPITNLEEFSQKYHKYGKKLDKLRNANLIYENIDRNTEILVSFLRDIEKLEKSKKAVNDKLFDNLSQYYKNKYGMKFDNQTQENILKMILKFHTANKESKEEDEAINYITEYCSFDTIKDILLLDGKGDATDKFLDKTLLKDIEKLEEEINAEQEKIDELKNSGEKGIKNEIKDIKEYIKEKKLEISKLKKLKRPLAMIANKLKGILLDIAKKALLHHNRGYIKIKFDFINNKILPFCQILSSGLKNVLSSY